MADPDRFFNFTTPGAQEWWYFDAISEDGRDAIVLVWYAALPFDPDYGVAALRHTADPARNPAPRGLDHCAFGMSWYRDGKTVAYALNGFRAGDFSHTDDPFTVAIGGNSVRRDLRGYSLAVATPAVDGRTQIAATLRFQPASGTESLERDLGTPESPHWWILAAADCRVEGNIAVGGRMLTFRGRGYHDHNAGSEEISTAMSRWCWGRVHLGSTTHVYYYAQPKTGYPQGLWITCRDGRPETIRDHAQFREIDPGRRNVFGIRHGKSLEVSDGPAQLVDSRSRCVDDGPFYRRWTTEMTVGPESGPAISELLDTRNLNRRLFNWMIPYRLKRPNLIRGNVS